MSYHSEMKPSPFAASPIGGGAVDEAGFRRAGVHDRACLTRRLVALRFGVAAAALEAPNRCKARIARARQAAMYLCHVTFGCSLTEVGEAFGRDRTTVAHACARIEDLRDDPAWDERLMRLERELLLRGNDDALAARRRGVGLGYGGGVVIPFDRGG